MYKFSVLFVFLHKFLLKYSNKPALKEKVTQIFCRQYEKANLGRFNVLPATNIFFRKSQKQGPKHLFKGVNTAFSFGGGQFASAPHSAFAAPNSTIIISKPSEFRQNVNIVDMPKFPSLTYPEQSFNSNLSNE